MAMVNERNPHHSRSTDVERLAAPEERRGRLLDQINFRGVDLVQERRDGRVHQLVVQLAQGHLDLGHMFSVDLTKDLQERTAVEDVRHAHPREHGEEVIRKSLCSIDNAIVLAVWV